jgi:hypothetical protein
MAKKPLYCCPEVFNAVKCNNLSYNADLAKNDCWSLGMILLEMGLCTSI